MDNEFSYDALVRRAGFRTKPKAMAKIITYATAGLGTILFGGGILLSRLHPETFKNGGLTIASVGLLVLAIVPPLYRFVFSKLIKRRLDKLIKLLEE